MIAWIDSATDVMMIASAPMIVSNVLATDVMMTASAAAETEEAEVPMIALIASIEVMMVEVITGSQTMDWIAIGKMTKTGIIVALDHLMVANVASMVIRT